MGGSASEGGDAGPIERVTAMVRGKYLFRIGAAVLVLTVVLLGAGAVTLQQTQASVGESAEETLVNAAEREATGLDELVETRNADVIRISGERSIITGDHTDIEAELRTNHAILPDSVVAIHYYNMDSNTIEASVSPGSVGAEFDEHERPWAVDFDAFEGQDDARSFQPYEVDGEKRLGFASPVEGRQSHAIVLEVDLQERGELLASPVEGGVVEAVSVTDGSVAVSSDTDAILEDHFLLDALPHLADDTTETRTDQVGLESDRIDDDEAVVATVPLEEKDWAVVVAAPESTLFETVGEVGQNILLLIGVAILGFVAVSAVISRDINGSISDLQEYATEIEAGNLDVEIDQSRSDEFGELSAVFARLRDTLQRQLQEVEERAQEAEEARERAEQAQTEAQTAKSEAEQFTEHLERTAARYHETIDAAADGDLTRRIDTDTESDAMVQVGEAVNRMLEDIETLVVRIQAAASEVDERSTEVTVSTDDIEATSRDVAESIDEISTGTERQRRQLERTTGEMDDLSATVEEIASSSTEIARQVERAADRGQAGQETASEAIEEIDHIEAEIDRAVEEVTGLSEEVDRISEIVDLIDDIAEETNILALNASIEAARAGEAGEGFGVVADEVKALAEETAEATQEVEALVGDVQGSTEEVAENMSVVQSSVEEGRETVEDTVDTLESIVDEVEDANAGVQSIDEATDQQADSTAEVVSMVDEAAEISERSAEEAQTVSAAAEEQTASIQQIAVSSETLSEQAETLQNLVDQFDTGRDAQNATDIDGDLADGSDSSGPRPDIDRTGGNDRPGDSDRSEGNEGTTEGDDGTELVLDED